MADLIPGLTNNGALRNGKCSDSVCEETSGVSDHDIVTAFYALSLIPDGYML